MACTLLQVVSEEKLKLERQVDTLRTKLAHKEARLRGSVDALAKASYQLRASFRAEVGWECCRWWQGVVPEG
jgi:cell division septum initiation protein DivIVA